jgi:CRP/FNR family transcriptional regulator
MESCSAIVLQRPARGGAVGRAICPAPEEKAGQAFLLASGSIQLIKTSAEGREVVIKTVSPGELFAEVILFEQDTYPVSALALANCELYRIPKAGLLRLLEKETFRHDFVAGLMKRMRYLADRILYLTTYDVEERFFRFLAQQFGRQEQITMTLSKKDTAAAIGATPETYSRLLLRLKSEGKIEATGKTLRVLDMTCFPDAP